MTSFRLLLLSGALAAFALAPGAARAQQPVPAAPAVVPAAPALASPAAIPPPAPVGELPGAHWEPDYSGGTAHVIRRDHTDVYIMGKPDRPYVVTGRIVSDLAPATTDERTGTVILTNVTISEMIDALLAQGRHRQIYYSFPYDALLTFDGQVGTFVRWKNKAAAPAPAKTPLADTSSTQQP